MFSLSSRGAFSGTILELGFTNHSFGDTYVSLVVTACFGEDFKVCWLFIENGFNLELQK